MTKTPGDGKPFITKAEQDAAYDDRQKADNATVREHGLDGLRIIAERNQEAES